MRDAILALGLRGLARAIEQGSVTSRAATEAVLGALDERGRALGAVVRLFPDEALREAERCDLERARGDRRGPLHGVPLAHKDMFPRKGWPSEMGSLIYRGHVAEVTASAIERLDAAGAVDVGRLSMVEFALGVTGHNAHTGTPRNAWDPAKITGGSTSGGATAVAAGLVAATLGSDTGGSIRGPASFCGITGLKPTYGRVSRAGAMPLSFSLDHVGPLARSAEDVALMLEVLAGSDPHDPSTSQRPAPTCLATLDRGIVGMRVAIVRGGYEEALDPEVETAFAEVAAIFRGLGATVGDTALPDPAPLNALRRLISVVEIAALHRHHVERRNRDYNRTTLARMEPGFAIDAADYVRALAVRGAVTRDYCRTVFADADILALPTIPEPTPTIAGLEGDEPAYVAASNRLGSLIGPFNLLGLPALSTPMGFDRSGMPLGLQLVARPFAEAALLRAAHAFERATPWSMRRPGTDAAGAAEKARA